MQRYLNRRGVRGTINLSSVPPAVASAVVLRPFLGAWYCPAVCLLQRPPGRTFRSTRGSLLGLDSVKFAS